MPTPEHRELTEKQRCWLGHLEACAKSDQSLSRYASTHDLDRQAFYNWKTRLRRLGLLSDSAAATTRGRRHSPQATGFTEARVTNSGESAPGFTPMLFSSVDATAPALRIRFANGIVVDFGDGSPPDRDLLSHLASLR